MNPQSSYNQTKHNLIKQYEFTKSKTHLAQELMEMVDKMDEEINWIIREAYRNKVEEGLELLQKLRREASKVKK